MKQSRGDSTIRTTKEDTMLPRITTVSGRHLTPPSSLGMNQYTLVRLSKVGDGNILDILDGKIGTVDEVPSIEELCDGSWEMAVLESYCPTLQAMLGKIFPGSDVDLNYDPTEPTVSEVENFGPEKAKAVCKYLFIERAERMVKEGWPMAADCYEHFKARIIGKWRSRL